MTEARLHSLRTSLQGYLDGTEPPGSLALLRPYQVAQCLEGDLLRFMLTLDERGDQPVLLRRLKRYAERTDAETYRRFESASVPLFSTQTS